MRTLTLLSLALFSLPVLAQDGLQRCRALTDTTARLACYDALADAAVLTRTGGPAAATAPVATAAPPRAAEAAFGLPEAKRPDAVEAVHSTVGPRFGGWGPNSRIRLANGQVWQVIDGSSVELPEGARKVSVKRGALGSFYLDFEGLNTSPRVRRVE